MRRIVMCAVVASCVGAAACGSAGAAPAKAAGGGKVSQPTVVADAGVVEAKPKDPEKKPDTTGSTTTTTTTTTTSASAGELVDTVVTATSRDSLSKFLVKPAKDAESKDRPKAIVLYRALVVARGPGSPEARELADLLRLEGQNDEARVVLEKFVASSSDAAAVSDAQSALTTLKGSDPFAKRLKLPSQDKLAKQVFKSGLAAFKKKKYGDALVLYSMGFALSPDLPGFLRKLGETYDKLGAKQPKTDYYLAYLRRRPFGKNADEIRKALDKGVLGTLSISSSLPCEQVWMNGVQLPGKLPKKDVKIAPGPYEAACYSETYGAFIKGKVTIVAGQSAQLTFQWAIVVNGLENPYGRIVIESALDPSGQTMIDLGIDKPAFGVPVPDDGHALHVVLKDDDGTKTVDRYVKLEAGQKTTIKW